MNVLIGVGAALIGYVLFGLLTVGIIKLQKLGASHE